MAFDLDRFVDAQDDGGTYATALAELRSGRKVSHWMWFVFPQIAGLGSSAMAQRYAVSGVAEARAYLAHPVLGPRLLTASRAVLESDAKDAGALLGGIDAMKLASSMTLFEAAAQADDPPDGVSEHQGHGALAEDSGADAVPAAADDMFAEVASVCGDVLDRYYAGRRDPETARRL